MLFIQSIIVRFSSIPKIAGNNFACIAMGIEQKLKTANPLQT